MRQGQGWWLVPVVMAAVLLSWKAGGIMAAPPTRAEALRRDAERALNQNHMLLERLARTFRLAAEALQPTGEVAAELERIDREAFDHYRAGRRGKARQAVYHGIAVLLGREWTERDDYLRSLALRTDMTVCDPARPLIARVEQVYASMHQPQSDLTLRVALLDGRMPRRKPPVKELGTLAGLPRELIDQPLSLSADLRDVKDGNYVLAVDVLEGEQPMRRISTPVRLVRGLYSTRDEIERRLNAIEGHESATATVRYPFDFALRVNLDLPLIVAGQYDFAAGIRRSKELLAELEAGRDPVYRAVGDNTRHYRLEGTGEIMPYRLYVPQGYDGERAYPLIVALHGSGGTENVMIANHNGAMKKLAEEHGYIVASPLGYRTRGGYGRIPKEFAQDRVMSRVREMSEKDVMSVLSLVRAEYRIDESRIYLMGHSMGGTGTWRLGSKYPDIWAALAPVASGGATPDVIDLERIKHIPVFVSHGDADAKAPVESSRAMVAKMKELGMTYEYFEKPGGTHAMMLDSRPKIIDFFNRHRRGE